MLWSRESHGFGIMTSKRIVIVIVVFVLLLFAVQELWLAGNPVVASEGSDKLRYHQAVKAIFPTLQKCK